jgi:uncharacterized membrane protein
MSETRGPESRRDARPDRWILLGIFAVALLARAIPISGDFWLDEIWTYYFSLDLGGAAEVFTRNHHSNNHHLNSLFFHWFGDRSNWAIYRIPALLAGIGSVVIAAMLGSRNGRLEAVFAALLTGGSFSLIHFSSEARGYAFAVFFALTATLFLDRFLARPSLRSAIAFGTCVGLGILSQLIFLFYYAGAVAQSGWRLLRSRSGCLEFAGLHLLPLACFAMLYWTNLRYLHVGRGNPVETGDLIAQTIGYGFGLPVLRELSVLYLAFASLLLAAGVRMLRREDDDSWILMLLAIAVAPIGVLSILRPEVIELRYFVISLALLLILAARLLAVLYRAGGLRRTACLTLLGAFLVGNTFHTLRFFEYGRGDYRGALSYMAEHTSADRIRVGSDHDFRNGIVLRFYQRLLPDGKRLIYHREGSHPQGGPDWMITHRADSRTRPPDRLADAAGNSYRYEREFEHASISGFTWTLYRNARAPQPEADSR